MRESWGSYETQRRSESKGRLTPEVRWPQGLQHRPIMISGERFESEHTCWDPKDGELCLSRVKPEETLVEARSDTDVQIVRQIWV